MCFSIITQDNLVYHHAISVGCSVTLSSPGGTDTELSFSTFWYAEDVLAVLANNNLLWVGVDGVDGVAHWAFDVHEERIGRLDLSLKLVLSSFFLWVNVK